MSDPAPLGRLCKPVDFERTLATPIRLRSPHFAVHHLDGSPAPARRPGKSPDTASLSTELSTVSSPSADTGVDDSRRWLGCVVPKRHARRAVTRVLIKRQIRQVAADCAPALPGGLWVVRQRAPFDVALFPSASSEALRVAARTELRGLFERACRDERDPPRPPRRPEARR